MVTITKFKDSTLLALVRRRWLTFFRSILQIPIELILIANDMPITILIRSAARFRPVGMATRGGKILGDLTTLWGQMRRAIETESLPCTFYDWREESQCHTDRSKPPERLKFMLVGP